jgi:hypothetical protein
MPNDFLIIIDKFLLKDDSPNNIFNFEFNKIQHVIYQSYNIIYQNILKLLIFTTLQLQISPNYNISAKKL